MEVKFKLNEVKFPRALPRGRATKEQLVVAARKTNGVLSAQQAILTPLEYKLILSTPYFEEYPLTPFGLFCGLSVQEINAHRLSPDSQEVFFLELMITRKIWEGKRDLLSCLPIRFSEKADFFGRIHKKYRDITFVTIRILFDLQRVNGKTLIAPPPIISKVFSCNINGLASGTFRHIKVAFPLSWVTIADMEIPYLAEDLARLKIPV